MRGLGPGGETLPSPPEFLEEGRVLRSLRAVVEGTVLCSLSTVDERGNPHSCHVYFAPDDELRLHFLSHPDAAHSRHIRDRGSVAISVYDSRQVWGGRDVGIAMEGMARECRGPGEVAAMRAYAKRFRGYRRWTRSDEFDRFGRRYRFYTFTPSRVKVFDERKLTAALFVTAEVKHPRIQRQKLDRQQSGASSVPAAARSKKRSWSGLTRTSRVR